jgi:hypothetical protein
LPELIGSAMAGGYDLGRGVAVERCVPIPTLGWPSSAARALELRLAEYLTLPTTLPVVLRMSGDATLDLLIPTDADDLAAPEGLVTSLRRAKKGEQRSDERRS